MNNLTIGRCGSQKSNGSVLYAEGIVKVTLIDIFAINNTASQGGVIYFHNNTAASLGGAVFQLTMSNSSFWNCTSKTSDGAISIGQHSYVPLFIIVQHLSVEEQYNNFLLSCRQVGGGM
jgi:hypothetical protein